MIFFYYFENQSNENLTVVGDGELANNKSISVMFKNQQIPNTIIAGDRKFILNVSTHVYEVNGKPPIWLYWDSENVPMFGLILIENIKCVNPEFEVILVHDSTIKQFWPDLHGSSFLNLTKNHRSDVFRVYILYKFGGIYMDIDTYPIHSFIQYYHLLTEYELVGGNWYSEPIAITHLGPARANILLFKLCTIFQWELIERKLNMYNHYPFYWGELISTPITILSSYLLQSELLKYYAIDGPGTIGQIVSVDLPKSYVFSFLGNLSWSFLALNQTPILYFHHSGREKSLDGAKLEDLLPMTVEDENIFSYVTKCALRQCFIKIRNHRNLEMYLKKFVQIPPIYNCFNFSKTTLPQLNVSMFIQ